MTNNRLTSLRQRAEAKLPKPKAELVPPSGEDSPRQVHELQVHQVELDMQNEELVHARTALEASTQKYTDLYDFAPVSYLTLDAKGNIREANLTAATYLGMNRAQLIGQPFNKFLAAESRTVFNAALHASNPGDAKRTCEVTLPKAGAPPRRARLEGVLLAADSGVEGHCRMVIFDITERKQSEAALRAVELLYHSLVERLPQNVFRKDCEGRFTFVNQRFCDTTGRVREEVIGRTDLDLFPDALAAKYQADDRRVMESRQPYAVVEEHVTPGQERLFVEVIKTPLVDMTGKVIGVQGIFWDVTERETAAETLRESQAGLATIFRASPAAISVNTVAAGRLIEVNDRFCEFIGQAREELVGKTILDLKLWAKPEDRAAVVERLLKAGAIHDHETRYRRQSGEMRDVLVSMELIDLAGESEPVLISMFTDITERKRAEEEVRQSGERYRTLFEHAPDGIVISSPEAYYLDANPSALRMLGYTRDELIGLPASATTAPTEIQRIGPALSVIKARVDYHQEWQLRRKDGSLFAADAHTLKKASMAKNRRVAIPRVTGQPSWQNPRVDERRSGIFGQGVFVGSILPWRRTRFEPHDRHDPHHFFGVSAGFAICMACTV